MPSRCRPGGGRRKAGKCLSTNNVRAVISQFRGLKTEHTSVIWCHDQVGDGIEDAEDEVHNSEPAHVDHRLAKGVLDHTITHADNQEQEEGEGVAGSVKNAHNNKEYLGTDV